MKAFEFELFDRVYDDQTMRYGDVSAVGTDYVVVCFRTSEEIVYERFSDYPDSDTVNDIVRLSKA